MLATIRSKGRVGGKGGMTEAGRRYRLDEARGAVEADIGGCHGRGDRIDVGRQHRDPRQPGDGDRQHRAAGPEVERAPRVFAAHDAADHFEAAGRGAVMPGAEGQAGLDLDGEGAGAPRCPVMGAVDEETAGPHRLQPFQRACHPIDVGHDFGVEFQVGIAGADDPEYLRPDAAGRFLIDIERNLVQVARLVEVAHGERKTVILERSFQRRVDALGRRAGRRHVESDLGQWRTLRLCRQPSLTSRFSLAIAVSGFSP